MTAPINHWPLPWRIATALARESGLDWARWALGKYATVTKVVFRPDDGFPLCEGWCVGQDDGESTLYPTPGEAVAHAVPVPDPSDAEAYRADCARRGVEPGPMPALSWTSEDGFGWRVEPRDWPRVKFSRRGLVLAEWDSVDDSVGWHTAPGIAALCIDAPREVVARIVALATAAARAMGVG